MRLLSFAEGGDFVIFGSLGGSKDSFCVHFFKFVCENFNFCLNLTSLFKYKLVFSFKYYN